MNLVSFDIDGTLLSISDPMEYVNSYVSAFTSQFEKPQDFRDYLPSKIAGLTDLSLIKYSINKATDNHANDENVKKFCDDFVKFFKINFQKGVTLTKGTKDFLDELKKKNTIFAICSGNLKEIGEMKLNECQILEYFDEELRGFCWSPDRSQILKMIIEKAKEKYDIVNVIHIGDTMGDAEASKIVGATPVLITQFGLDKSVEGEHVFENFDTGKQKIFSLLK